MPNLSGVCGQGLFAKFMQLKISSRRIPLIVPIAGFALFSVFLFRSVRQSFNLLSKQFGGKPEAIIENAVASSSQEQADVGVPVRLKIPSINVDAPVEYVGLTPDGAMDAPKGPVGVAWFSLGPRPGEKGSSVVAGHYGWKNNMPAVFDNLYKLRQGDRLSVESDKGDIISFIVIASRRYDPHADASDVFVSNDGKSYLNLVTCEGSWDKVSKSYSKRLVIFTEKE